MRRQPEPARPPSALRRLLVLAVAVELAAALLFGPETWHVHRAAWDGLRHAGQAQHGPVHPGRGR